jgi:chromosomal replication initiation ATPase DnaA
MLDLQKPEYRMHALISHRTPRPNIPIPNTNDLISIACRITGCNAADISTRTRLRFIVNARILVTTYLASNTTKTAQAIGRIFGREHATILHYRRQYTSLMQFDQDFQTDNASFLDEIKKLNSNYPITMKEYSPLVKKRRKAA